MAFHYVSRISVNYDENISARQSTCYQTVPKFYISQKEMFCNCICLGLMENWDVSGAVLIWPVIVTREHVDSSKVFQNGSFLALK